MSNPYEEHWMSVDLSRIAKERDAMQAIPTVTAPVATVPTCPTCHTPTHASESNDAGQCFNCARPEEVKLTDGLIPYRGWRASYEFPGQIEWRHPHTTTVVFSTPDHQDLGWLSIEIQQQDGGGPVQVPKTSANMGEGIDEGAEVPFPVRTSDALFAAVKPWLDLHYPKHPAYAYVLAALTEHMDGINGPEGKEYVEIMENLRAEIARRIDTYVSNPTRR
ncbi:MAG TPA: hypothetical protein VGM94_00870 [Galbitalea sp.]